MPTGRRTDLKNNGATGKAGRPYMSIKTTPVSKTKMSDRRKSGHFHGVIASPTRGTNAENEYSFSAQQQEHAHLPTLAKAASAHSKTPTKHRVNLGVASSYYFKNGAKTPLQAEISARRKLNSSIQTTDDSALNLTDVLDGSFENSLSYNNRMKNESSFLSSASSSSSSSGEGIDILENSVLSDTTELTAPNYVLNVSSRRLMSQQQQKFSQLLSQHKDLQPKKESLSQDTKVTRKPLAAVSDNYYQSRKSLPAQATKETPKNYASRRESWHGQVNVDSAAKATLLASTLRNRRASTEQRQENDDQGRRLSNASLRSIVNSSKKKTAESTSSMKELPPISLGQRISHKLSGSEVKPVPKPTETVRRTSVGARENDDQPRRLSNASTRTIVHSSQKKTAQSTSSNKELPPISLRLSQKLSAPEVKPVPKVAEIQLEAPRTGSGAGARMSPDGESRISNTSFDELFDGISDTSSSLDLDQRQSLDTVGRVSMANLLGDLQDPTITLDNTLSSIATAHLLQQTSQDDTVHSTTKSPPFVEEPTRGQTDVNAASKAVITETDSSTRKNVSKSSSQGVSSDTSSTPDKSTKMNSVTKLLNTPPQRVPNKLINTPPKRVLKLQFDGSPSDPGTQTDVVSSPKDKEHNNSQQKSSLPFADSPARNTRSSKANKENERLSGIGPENGTINSEEKPNSTDAEKFPVSSPDQAVALTTKHEAVNSPNKSNSPEKNKKSFSLADSPARNTRSSKANKGNNVAKETTISTPPSVRRARDTAESPLYEDSPARNTRSATKAKRTPSPARQSRTSPRQLNGSPAPTTLNATKVSEEVENDNITELVVGMGKRQRENCNVKPIHKAMMEVDDTQQTNLVGCSPDQKRCKPSSTTPRSSLRRTRSTKKNESMRKSVAFGCPEVAEYNIGSPSMSYTPVPSKRAKTMYAMPDDTVEIEADMHALLNGGEQFNPSQSSNAQDAGCTPRGSKGENIRGGDASQSNENTNESEFAGDFTSMEMSGVADSTVEIEVDMDQLLNNADNEIECASSVSKEPPSIAKSLENLPKSNDRTLEETPDSNSSIAQSLTLTNNSEAEPEHTVQLEDDMPTLLGKSLEVSMPKESVNTTRYLTQSDPLTQSPGSTHEMSNIEEGNTVDLELDMHSLLSKAAPSPSVLGSESPSSSSVDESTPIIEEQFELKSNEIYEESGLQMDDLEFDTDVLVKVNGAISMAGISIMTETMTSCLTQVCSMIEEQLPEDVDPEMLLELSDDNIDNLLALQRAWRSNQRQDIQKELKHLAEAVRISEQHNFSNWITSVGESLKGPNGIGEGFGEGLQEGNLKIRDFLKVVEDSEEILKSIKSKVERNSRWKSLDKRKVSLTDCKFLLWIISGFLTNNDLIVSIQSATNALKEQVADLERQLTRAKTRSKSSKVKYELLHSLTTASSNQEALKEQIALQRQDAESSERQCVILRGMNKWKPVTVDEGEMSFNWIGPCHGACVQMKFVISGPQSVFCEARVQRNLFPNHKFRSAEKFQSVATFIEVRVSEFCNKTSKEHLDCPTKISPFLRSAEWSLGRLEQTALELMQLQKRYRTVLSPCPKSSPGLSEFQLQVQFPAPNESTVLTTLSFSEEYPFSLSGFNLEQFGSKVDIQKMRKLLTRNIKPGFGYMTRICDEISSLIGK